MANSGELTISNKNMVYTVKVAGRATFECAPPLRNLAKSLEKELFTLLKVDLSECSWMDSTFMGILAMLGLRAKKVAAPMEIYGAGEQNKALLLGLGLKKLFVFKDGKLSVEDGELVAPEDTAPNAQTVLDAHKTLMAVDESNVGRFEKVVDMVQQDIDRNAKTDKK